MPHRSPNEPAWLLRKFRTELKLTQQALADLLGVTRVTLSGWERGRALPSLAKAVLLEQRAGIPPFAWHRQGRATP
jgi:transcriptional regulator with XRE-family HTH domain